MIKTKSAIQFPACPAIHQHSKKVKIPRRAINSKLSAVSTLNFHLESEPKVGRSPLAGASLFSPYKSTLWSSFRASHYCKARSRQTEEEEPDEQGSDLEQEGQQYQQISESRAKDGSDCNQEMTRKGTMKDDSSFATYLMSFGRDELAVAFVYFVQGTNISYRTGID